MVESAVGELASLQTEARNPNTFELDALSPIDLVRALHDENYSVAEAIEPALPQISKALVVISDRLRTGGRMYYIGAGTSGRLGVLDASECPPTFGISPDSVQGIIAGGDHALRNSIEGAEDDPAIGAAEITSRGIGTKDVVVGIAASGRTPYVIGGLGAARKAGAFTVALTNVRPSALESYADITITAVTGPEPITGSTRMKAGTAQKMILNLLSTGVMVLLGKTYGNLMVDVKATNAKLRDRAERIVMTAAGVDRSTAIASLEGCDWHAKTAIVSIMRGVEPGAARKRLAESDGFVRRALEK